MGDKRAADFLSNHIPSPSSSTFSPGNLSAKDTSLAHLTVSITAETEASDNDEMDDGEKSIKTENFGDSNVEASDRESIDTMAKHGEPENKIELKHVPIKPEPIRLPVLQQ